MMGEDEAAGSHSQVLIPSPAHHHPSKDRKTSPDFKISTKSSQLG